MLEKLWVEKYRPTNLSDYVFQNQQQRTMFESLVTKKEIPNLLLSGVQGTGKTTLSKILCNELDIDPSDRLVINASSESGIDNVREKITNFCSTFPLSKFKIVCLEECDGLSHHAQLALRHVMEEYSDTVRFILTCNYPHKIIPAIQSRTQHIHIEEFDMDALFDRVLQILNNENIQVENPDFLVNHVAKFAPDLRKIINSLQQSSTTGTLEDVGSSQSVDIEDKWSDAWKNPTLENLLSLVGLVDNNNYEKFYETMYKNVENLNDPKLINNAIIVIAEHLYKSSLVSNQEINLAACVIKIFSD